MLDIVRFRPTILSFIFCLPLLFFYSSFSAFFLDFLNFILIYLMGFWLSQFAYIQWLLCELLVKKEGSKILPYWKANKLVWCSIMDTGRRHETPWSEIRDSLLLNTNSSNQCISNMCYSFLRLISQRTTWWESFDICKHNEWQSKKWTNLRELIIW